MTFIPARGGSITFGFAPGLPSPALRPNPGITTKPRNEGAERMLPRNSATNMRCIRASELNLTLTVGQFTHLPSRGACRHHLLCKFTSGWFLDTPDLPPWDLLLSHRNRQTGSGTCRAHIKRGLLASKSRSFPPETPVALTGVGGKGPRRPR